MIALSSEVNQPEQITMTTQTECLRCSGKGHINGFAHVQDGICFKCNGKGTVDAPKVRKPSAKQLAAKAAKEAAAQIKADEYNRKTREAVTRYTGDPRIKISQDNSWYAANCIQWAQYDKVWDSL
jgi:DnaJ-class molecular chaperone